jgi:F0F1-type ATP synthase assembly protein I
LQQIGPCCIIQLMPGTDSQGNSAGGGYARFFGIGFTFVFVIVVLCAVGYFVDGALGTMPLFLLLGLGLGFAAGLYYLYVALRKLGNG